MNISTFLQENKINSKFIVALFLFHIAVIAVSNYLVQFPQVFYGIEFTWAMFTFPLVVIATDLTIRLTNAQNARLIIACAFIPAILISYLLADLRIGLASGIAYAVGQFLDIAVFKKIYTNNTPTLSGKNWWIAPAISTFLANIIDTYLFYSLAFMNGKDEFMAENWVSIANTDLMLKIIVSLLIFLPLYKLLLDYLESRIK